MPKKVLQASKPLLAFGIWFPSVRMLKVTLKLKSAGEVVKHLAILHSDSRNQSDLDVFDIVLLEDVWRLSENSADNFMWLFNRDLGPAIKMSQKIDSVPHSLEIS